MNQGLWVLSGGWVGGNVWGQISPGEPGCALWSRTYTETQKRRSSDTLVCNRGFNSAHHGTSPTSWVRGINKRRALDGSGLRRRCSVLLSFIGALNQTIRGCIPAGGLKAGSWRGREPDADHLQSPTHPQRVHTGTYGHRPGKNVHSSDHVNHARITKTSETQMIKKFKVQTRLIFYRHALRM